MVWGLVGGVALDMLSGVPIGTTSITLILIAMLVSLYEDRIWEANFLMPLGITLIGSLIFHIMSLAVIMLMGREIDWSYMFMRVILPSTFFNLLLAIPSAQVFKALRNRLYPPEVEI
jgi:rod shape-determining protein MreD